MVVVVVESGWVGCAREKLCALRWKMRRRELRSATMELEGKERVSEIVVEMRFNIH